MTRQVVLPGVVEAPHAVFSGDRRYRYYLSRPFVGEGRSICWIMLNPSTADEDHNDPTVRRCIGFATDYRFEDGGRCGYMHVLNLFAFRATDPHELKGEPDPIGPENDIWIEQQASSSDLVVCAWGAHGQYLGRGAQVKQRLLDRGIALWCLGCTSSGEPRHPLYVASYTPFQELR